MSIPDLSPGKYVTMDEISNVQCRDRSNAPVTYTMPAGTQVTVVSNTPQSGLTGVMYMCPSLMCVLCKESLPEVLKLLVKVSIPQAVQNTAPSTAQLMESVGAPSEEMPSKIKADGVSAVPAIHESSTRGAAGNHNV